MAGQQWAKLASVHTPPPPAPPRAWYDGLIDETQPPVATQPAFRSPVVEGIASGSQAPLSQDTLDLIEAEDLAHQAGVARELRDSAPMGRLVAPFVDFASNPETPERLGNLRDNIREGGRDILNFGIDQVMSGTGLHDAAQAALDFPGAVVDTFTPTAESEHRPNTDAPSGAHVAAQRHRDPLHMIDERWANAPRDLHGLINTDDNGSGFLLNGAIPEIGRMFDPLTPWAMHDQDQADLERERARISAASDNGYPVAIDTSRRNAAADAVGADAAFAGLSLSGIPVEARGVRQLLRDARAGDLIDVRRARDAAGTLAPRLADDAPMTFEGAPRPVGDVLDVPAEEVLPNPSVGGQMRAAIRDPETGRIYTGANHFEAIDDAPEAVQARLGHEYQDQNGPNIGFLRGDQFLTREEAMRDLGRRATSGAALEGDVIPPSEAASRPTLRALRTPEAREDWASAALAHEDLDGGPSYYGFRGPNDAEMAVTIEPHNPATDPFGTAEVSLSDMAHTNPRVFQDAWRPTGVHTGSEARQIYERVIAAIETDAAANQRARYILRPWNPKQGRVYAVLAQHYPAPPGYAMHVADDGAVILERTGNAQPRPVDVREPYYGETFGDTVRRMPLMGTAAGATIGGLGAAALDGDDAGADTGEHDEHGIPLLPILGAALGGYAGARGMRSVVGTFGGGGRALSYDLDAVIARLRSGESFYDVARSIGQQPASLERVIQRRIESGAIEPIDITRRSSAGAPLTYDLDEVVRRIREGETPAAVARSLGVARNTITQAVDRAVGRGEIEQVRPVHVEQQGLRGDYDEADVISELTRRDAQGRLPTGNEVAFNLRGEDPNGEGVMRVQIHRMRTIAEAARVEGDDAFNALAQRWNVTPEKLQEFLAVKNERGGFSAARVARELIASGVHDNQTLIRRVLAEAEHARVDLDPRSAASTVSSQRKAAGLSSRGVSTGTEGVSVGELTDPQLEHSAPAPRTARGGNDPLAGISAGALGLGAAAAASDEAHAQSADELGEELHGVDYDGANKLSDQPNELEDGSIRHTSVWRLADGRIVVREMDQDPHSTGFSAPRTYALQPSNLDVHPTDGIPRAGDLPPPNDRGDPPEVRHIPDNFHEAHLPPWARGLAAVGLGLATRGVAGRMGARGVVRELPGFAAAGGLDTALGGEPDEALMTAGAVPLGGFALEHSQPITRALGSAEDTRIYFTPGFQLRRNAFANTLPESAPMARVSRSRAYGGEVPIGPNGRDVVDISGDELRAQGFSHDEPVTSMPSQRQQFLDASPSQQLAWMEQLDFPNDFGPAAPASPRRETNRDVTHVRDLPPGVANADRAAAGEALQDASRRGALPPADEPLALPPPGRLEVIPEGDVIGPPQSPPGFFDPNTGRPLFGTTPRQPRAPRPPLEERAMERGAAGALQGVNASTLRRIAGDLDIETQGVTASELKKTLVRNLGRSFDSTRELVAFLARYGVSGIPLGLAAADAVNDEDQRQ